MNKIFYRQVNTIEEHYTHVHPYAQIIIPNDGWVKIRHSNTLVQVMPGEFGFIPPHCPHAAEQESGSISLICIPEQMIKKSDIGYFPQSMSLQACEQIDLAIRLILKEMDQNPDSESVKYLFFYLYDKIMESNKSKSIQYINQYYSENISVAQLAEIEHYNISYYTDWFKKRTGMLPSEYIQKIRLEKSKDLLTNTNYRVIDIAAQVGYINSSSFTRLFKMHEGISPKEYRATSRQQAQEE